MQVTVNGRVPLFFSVPFSSSAVVRFIIEILQRSRFRLRRATSTPVHGWNPYRTWIPLLSTNYIATTLLLLKYMANGTDLAAYHPYRNRSGTASWDSCIHRPCILPSEADLASYQTSIAMRLYHLERQESGMKDIRRFQLLVQTHYHLKSSTRIFSTSISRARRPVSRV